MIDRVKESLKWLGIGTDATKTVRENVFEELVRLAKQTHKPVKALAIAARVGRHRNRIHVHLAALRDEGRVEHVGTGWIPLK